MTRARLPCSLHFPDQSLRTKVSIIQNIVFSRSHEFTNTAGGLVGGSGGGGIHRVGGGGGAVVVVVCQVHHVRGGGGVMVVLWWLHAVVAVSLRTAGCVSDSFWHRFFTKDGHAYCCTAALSALCILRVNGLQVRMYQVYRCNIKRSRKCVFFYKLMHDVSCVTCTYFVSGVSSC